MKRLTQRILIAAGMLGLTAAPAAAAVVTNDLNLRSGPGTEHRVITAMPSGARVDVNGCRANWCEVHWRGYSGYASASYLAGEDRYTRSPAPRATYYDYYERPRYRTYDYGPRFGFSLRLGDDRYDRRYDSRVGLRIGRY